MIRYALVCEHGHSFESWFRDSVAYDVQANRGMLSCPHCGSGTIEKQIMAPALNGVDRADVLPAVMEGQISADKSLKTRQMLRAFRALVEANTENVGPQFAEEARKIHYGEVEERAIRGEASPAQVEALREEGVEISALPILPDERN